MTKQLRGDALANRIKEVIEELAAEAVKAGRPFIFNASRLATLVPASRTTLRRYDKVISSALQALKAGRRTSSGAAEMAKLREDVARFQLRQEELEREVTAMRRHHVEIYRQFQLYSADVAPLIRPILKAQCRDAGHCSLCGTAWKDGMGAKSNVVHLSDKQGPHHP